MMKVLVTYLAPDCAALTVLDEHTDESWAIVVRGERSATVVPAQAPSVYVARRDGVGKDLPVTVETNNPEEARGS